MAGIIPISVLDIDDGLYMQLRALDVYTLKQQIKKSHIDELQTLVQILQFLAWKIENNELYVDPNNPVYKEIPDYATLEKKIDSLANTPDAQTKRLLAKLPCCFAKMLGHEWEDCICR